MNPILFYDKLKEKIALEYRKYVFRKKIKCDHSDFSIYGKISLVNCNIKLGRNVKIYPDVMLFGDGLIEISDNVSIGNGTIIYSSKHGGGVRIGKDTMIAAQCYIIDSDHGIKSETPIRKQENTVAPVIIGNDCWLAANVTVLKGSVIGDGAVIGAKSLVKSRIEANSVCVGIPAKKIKMRE